MSEWKVKRDETEFTVENTQMLRDWAKQGLIAPTDYVYNPTLQRWMYAREVAELQQVASEVVAEAKREAVIQGGTRVKQRVGAIIALTLFMILFGVSGCGWISFLPVLLIIWIVVDAYMPQRK